MSWEDDEDDEAEITTHRVTVLVLTDGVFVVGVDADGSLFVVGFDADADDWTWPNDHPAGSDQAKIRKYPDDAVAFAAKIFSNDRECRLKFEGEVITVGPRLQHKQKTCIVAMINHVHGTAYTTAHVAKLKDAVARRSKAPATTEN